MAFTLPDGMKKARNSRAFSLRNGMHLLSNGMPPL
jgi:hypothetical protein